MKKYIDQYFEQLLELNGLLNFSHLNSLQLPTVDNIYHSGKNSSGVYCLALKDESGDEQTFYIKRQTETATRSLLNPLGAPLARRELRNILLYQRYDVAALEAVYYREEKTEAGFQSILITKSLENYRPLSDYLERWNEQKEENKLRWIASIGTLIGKLHARRISQDGCLPECIFVDLDADKTSRFTQLETSHFSIMPIRCAIADLAAFIHQSHVLSDSEIDIFLQNYLAAHRLGLTFFGLKKRLHLRIAKKSNETD